MEEKMLSSCDLPGVCSCSTSGSLNCYYSVSRSSKSCPVAILFALLAVFLFGFASFCCMRLSSSLERLNSCATSFFHH